MTDHDHQHDAPRPVVFQGLEAGLRLFRWVVVVLLLVFLLSGLTTVNSGFVGLKLRFGRLVGTSPREQIHQPGLVLALPEPIDQVIDDVPGPDREEEVVVDEVWKPIDELAAVDKINPIVEGYVLTGDQNIVQAKVRVKYRVTDPVRFRLWVSEPDGILRDTVMAAMMRTIGGWRVNDVLRLQKTGDDPTQTQSLAATIRRRAQERLDRLDSGLTISALEFDEIHPPRHVVAEFRDVQNARIEMETKKRDAEGFVRSRLPQAEAESNQMVKQAMAYENTLAATAKAELSVFEQIHQEYRNNPDLVRQRILLETFEQIIQQVGRRIFLPEGSRLILPLEKSEE
jgi:membrane protease subunit HflK